MNFRNPYRSKANPYGRKKVSHSGYTFDSKLESAVFDLLKLREKAGEIKSIVCQQTVYLTAAKIGYRCDFQAIEISTGRTRFFEAKGFANDVWPLKKKLWKFYGPGPLEIWKGSYQRPYLDETIIPQDSMEDIFKP